MRIGVKGYVRKEWRYSNDWSGEIRVGLNLKIPEDAKRFVVARLSEMEGYYWVYDPDEGYTTKVVFTFYPSKREEVEAFDEEKFVEKIVKAIQNALIDYRKKAISIKKEFEKEYVFEGDDDDE